jgi:membrane protein implicated in regulation of membrane protease activity
MTWSDFYLICFIVGFALSLISVMGSIFHVPGLHHAHGHHGHVHIGHAHGRVGGSQVSPLNFSTLTAFLAWFGGVGYLLTTFSGMWLWLAFLFSLAGGVLGGSIIFLFLVKVLLAHDTPMDAADYDMIGVFGHLTSAIRESGTGEMSFSQAGVRRSAAARSEDGSAIPKGADVIVTRYDKGIAYVRPWEDLTDSKDAKETL